MRDIFLGNFNKTLKMKDLKVGNLYVTKDNLVCVYLGRDSVTTELVFYTICGVPLYTNYKDGSHVASSELSDILVRNAAEVFYKYPDSNCVKLCNRLNCFFEYAYPDVSIPVEILRKFWLKLSMIYNVTYKPSFMFGKESPFCSVKEMEVGRVYKSPNRDIFIYLGRDGDGKFLYFKFLLSFVRDKVTAKDLFNNNCFINLKNHKELVVCDNERVLERIGFTIDELEKEAKNCVVGWHK